MKRGKQWLVEIAKWRTRGKACFELFIFLFVNVSFLGLFFFLSFFLNREKEAMGNETVMGMGYKRETTWLNKLCCKGGHLLIIYVQTG